MTGADAELRTGRTPSLREPLVRAERIQIAMFAGLVAMFAAMLGVGALGYSSLSGQLLDMQQQIGGLHTEVEGIRTEMHDEIGQLRSEMQHQFGQLSERIARIETVLHIHHGPLPGP